MTPEQLKASILQYAMEGKLVKQDPNDEPASELVKKIENEKKEKLKKVEKQARLLKMKNLLIFLIVGVGLDLMQLLMILVMDCMVRLNIRVMVNIHL